jgi:hypothetical protein
MSAGVFQVERFWNLDSKRRIVSPVEGKGIKIEIKKRQISHVENVVKFRIKIPSNPSHLPLGGLEA